MAGWLRKPVALALGALVVMAALWALYDAWTARPKAEARLGRSQTGAALDSGRDAVGTVGAQQAREAGLDRITEENDDAIRSAPGADAPVDPALRDLARRRLCRRPSYRDTPQCLTR